MSPFNSIKTAYQGGRLVSGQGNPPVAQKAKPTQPTPSVPAAQPTVFNKPLPVAPSPWRKEVKDLKTVSEAIAAAGAQMNSTVQSFGNAGNSDQAPGGEQVDLKTAANKINDSQEAANMGSPVADV